LQPSRLVRLASFSVALVAVACLLSAGERLARAAPHGETPDRHGPARARVPKKPTGRPAFQFAWKPLPVFFGSYSGHVEGMLAGRVGLGLDLYSTSINETHGATSDNDWTWSTSSTSGVGGELGLRFYFAGLRFGGWSTYAGLSALYGSYAFHHWSAKNDYSPVPTNSQVDFTRSGVAADLGAIYVSPEGFTFTVGGGLQQTALTNEPNLSAGDGSTLSALSTANLMLGSGLRPRTLVAFGWSF
jgi:hypothetical protein